VCGCRSLMDGGGLGWKLIVGSETLKTDGVESLTVTTFVFDDQSILFVQPNKLRHYSTL
jgi:hypothetical protein